MMVYWCLLVAFVVVLGSADAVRPKTAMMVVADSNYQIKHAGCIGTLRCYAKQHGYGFLLVKPGRFHKCRGLEFFFAKHCTVAEQLGRMPADSILFVFDADVAAGFNGAGLDRWLEHGRASDLVFYERELQSGEVMAGNYMVRNTPFARRFLCYWSSFFYVQPPGFSSYDNGAVHQALIDVIGFDDAARCRAAYDGLNVSVDDLQPYWNFVACARYLLGPARRWRIDDSAWGAGVITLLPFFHSWCADVPYLLGRYCNDVYPCCHGVKREAGDSLLVEQPLRLDADGCLAHCQPPQSAVVSRPDMGRWAAVKQAQIAAKRGPGEHAQLPVWRLDHGCLGRLTCAPLADESDWQRAYHDPRPAEWLDSPWRQSALSTGRSAERWASVIGEIRAHPKRDALVFSTTQ